jgi:hypothetical protein
MIRRSKRGELKPNRLCQRCGKRDFKTFYRCNDCALWVCRGCIAITAKDHGGPICGDCARLHEP